MLCFLQTVFPRIVPVLVPSAAVPELPQPTSFGQEAFTELIACLESV